MAKEDLSERHGLLHRERDEGEGIRGDRLVGERRGDGICIMHADGDFFPVPSQTHVQFFL